MDFRSWTYPATESMYPALDNNSPFATNVSSFFRRSSKIVKPNSRNTSPRHNGRRRTTSNAQVSRTRSLLDKQRSSFQHHLSAQQQARPLSWHPNSYPDLASQSQAMPVTLSYSSYAQYMYPTTAINGLVTPVSYPLPDEPQIQELITPLEDLSAQEAGHHYDETGYRYQWWMAPDMSKEQVYAMDSMFPQQPVAQQVWQYQPHQPVYDIPTAPPSPTFLPIQGAIEASPLSLDTRDLPSNVEGEELIGMGLYDSPADVQSSSLLFGTGLGVGRKRSLKLEESFEPASEEDEAEDEKDEDGAAEEEEDEEAEPEFPIQQHQAMQPASSMIGQSFFFDAEHDVNAAAYATNLAQMQNGGYQMQQYHGYGGWV